MPGPFGWLSRRFHTPWLSILLYAVTVWGLAIHGNFAWNVTLSAVSRLFFYAVVCAALIALRQKQPGAARFRLPGGPVLAVAGILLCILMATQVDLSQSRILAVTVAAALLNWVWARWLKPARGSGAI
jgi:basic amino acid/polyamine antiporter, APA family